MWWDLWWANLRIWGKTCHKNPFQFYRSGKRSMSNTWTGRKEISQRKLMNFDKNGALRSKTHSSVLAWRIPRTGEPGGPLFMGSHRVGHDWSDLAAAAAYSTQRLIYWWQVPFTLGGISAINRHFLSLAKWEILSALSYFIFNFFGVQRHYHELPLINNILSWG